MKKKKKIKKKYKLSFPASHPLYTTDDEFVGTDNNDDQIKISFEFKGCPKLICYIRNKRESAPQFKISTEKIDELARIE